MSLKSYLQSLISALLKKSVENASPYPTIYQSVAITQASQEVVSPVDGWAEIFVANSSGNASYVRLNSTGEFSHQHFIGAYNYATQLHIPCKKGNTIIAEVSGFSGAPWLNFYRRIGGGAKAHIRALIHDFLEGGGLCLRLSFRHYLKLCARRYSLAKTALIISCKTHSPALSRLLMAMLSASLRGSAMLPQSTLSKGCLPTSSRPTLILGELFGFRVEKVRRLLSQSQEVANRLCGLLRQDFRSNSLFDGKEVSYVI